MREWASSNGAVVRQRIGRHETTMARSGTLPQKNAYYEEFKPISDAEKKCSDEHETDSKVNFTTNVYKCAQQLYFIAPITRKHILKIVSRRLQTMQSNH